VCALYPHSDLLSTASNAARSAQTAAAAFSSARSAQSGKKRRDDMEIHKKIWPEFFEKVQNGEKDFELRLADFDIKKGDILILEEYDPKTKQCTGRKIVKKCNSIMKVNPMSFYSTEEIEKNGLYVIGLEK
jgi:hypothetical protein